MKVKSIAQGDGANTLEAALADALHGQPFDQIDVAVAYATTNGLQALLDLLPLEDFSSRWVIGLDDAISQPDAIEHLMGMVNAELRTAALAPARRFHPKLFRFTSSSEADLCMSVVGSGNMTGHGLRLNGEAAAILIAENADDAERLEHQWLSLWGLGSPITKEELDEYRTRYNEARKARKKIIDLGVAPSEPSSEPISKLDGNPETAGNAWLEVGTATQGKELEIPKPILGSGLITSNR